MKKEIGVLIADDHLLVRQGIKNLLETQKGIKILGEAVDGIDAVNKTLEMKPDVLLLDINMPKMNGIEALGVIKKENPKQKIIILTIHNSKDYIKKTINCGANGYISKNADITMLKDAIERVYHGETYIQPTIAKTLVTSENKKETKKEISASKSNNELKLNDVLTSREIDILKGIVDGKTNKEIGKDLDISDKTVRNHLYNIFKKLGVTDRTQVAIMVLKSGIIDE